jgi:predicted acylesterase/phospholipase RssA
MKRAITLAGGGPAAGLHIGVLERLHEAGIKFDNRDDVWALSCIGAWVGLIYNQCDPGKEVDQTYNFFRDGVFRDDDSYSRFPVNSVFGTDNFANMKAMMEFWTDPQNKNLWLPGEIMKAAQESIKFVSEPSLWNEGDFNRFVLNSVLAPNPFVRCWMSMMYLSKISGLSRIYWPESSFMRAIKFSRLYDEGKPFIFHNAWNITKQKLALFSNRPSLKPKSTKPKPQLQEPYQRITSASLCACSALPYIEETVEIGGDIYCEGALVDTVNFERLLEDHPDLDEVWISRIVDAKQVHPPRNIAEALGNLCMLFAATVGEDDVKLFRYHVKYDKDVKWHGKIIEIRVPNAVNFEWTHSNLDRGREAGYRAAGRALEDYKPDKPKAHTSGKELATAPH